MDTPMGVRGFGVSEGGVGGHADKGRARGGPGIGTERLAVGNSDREAEGERGEASLGRESRTRPPELLNDNGGRLKLLSPPIVD